jgi:hypothetical protein
VTGALVAAGISLVLTFLIVAAWNRWRGDDR